MSFLALYGFLRLPLQSALAGQPGCQEVPPQRRQRSNERVVDNPDITPFLSSVRIAGRPSKTVKIQDSSRKADLALLIAH